MHGRGMLIFFCGKMAAGKTTRARELAARHGAVLLSEDAFLEALYPGEIRSIEDYVRCSRRVRQVLTPHVRDLLKRGMTVVLDFAANTRTQRGWFRSLLEGIDAEHELHYVEASDELCKRQLRQRRQDLPPGSAWTSDAEFDAITAYFEAPAADEGFNVVRHLRE